MRGSRGVLLLLSVSLLLVTFEALAEPPPVSYWPHPPIHVDGNDDLQEVPGITSGDGSREDPFRITGWEIVALPFPFGTGAVAIRNTDLHVRIESNRVHSPAPGQEGIGCGIFIWNAKNVTISDNVATGSNHGVCVFHSSQTKIEGNDLSGAADLPLGVTVRGIQVFNSTAVRIASNDVNGFLSGIGVQGGSVDVDVVGNTIEDTGPYGGIDVTSASRVRLSDNIVRATSHAAVQVYSSSDVSIIGNHLSDHGTGIHADALSGSDLPESIRIAQNRIDQGAWAFALYCNNCTVAMNDVCQNDAIGILVTEHQLDLVGNAFKLVEQGIVGLGGTVDAHHNDFHDPPAPLVEAQRPLDWTSNWWGRSGGPAPGVVLGPVTVEPWLDEPRRDACQPDEVDRE